MLPFSLFTATERNLRDTVTAASPRCRERNLRIERILEKNMTDSFSTRRKSSRRHAEKSPFVWTYSTGGQGKKPPRLKKKKGGGPLEGQEKDVHRSDECPIGVQEKT